MSFDVAKIGESGYNGQVTSVRILEDTFGFDENKLTMLISDALEGTSLEQCVAQSEKFGFMYKGRAVTHMPGKTGYSGLISTVLQGVIKYATGKSLRVMRQEKDKLAAPDPDARHPVDAFVQDRVKPLDGGFVTTKQMADFLGQSTMSVAKALNMAMKAHASYATPKRVAHKEGGKRRESSGYSGIEVDFS